MPALALGGVMSSLAPSKDQCDRSERGACGTAITNTSKTGLKPV